ncbi:MAG: hypothetical protein CVV22_09275 [Ignavibacteriae bacterium HGW-Ignavibacteriae-1]|nr:MAG: hypothetical protein CVV22_09275 [Ignavibacteriae bacterium HGW-Ignavibacteriae-1]
MKWILFAFIAAFFAVSCSDTSNNPQGNRVVLSSAMTESNVSSMVHKSSDAVQSAEYADSLLITDFKMLISRVKFHGGNTTSNDTTFDESKGLQFVTGAFVVRSDSNNSGVVFADASLKEGTYNKIKIEMHRLSPSDLVNYLTKPYFSDFATSDRHTIAVRGKYYQNGEAFDFTYFSNVVLNFTFNLDPPITIDDSGEYRYEFAFDPAIMFTESNGSIFVPSMLTYRDKIEKNIKASFKLKKK